MSFTRILSVIILILGGTDYASCQVFSSPTAIQSFLNQICNSDPTSPGCGDSSIGSVPIEVAPPVQPDPRPQEPCFENGKRCPQGICIPNNIDCNVLDSSITCRVPEEYGLEVQVVLCGDGKLSGLRCGNGVDVPQFSVMITQCQGSNSVNPRPISSLSVLNGPGDDGGAGVYDCSPEGIWVPKFDSPSLKQLIVSCRNAGCGRVPQPSDEMPIHRRWAWVRGIYKGGKLHCLGTLVSPGALVTAAHCVTRSLVTNQKDTDVRNYQIELPGPDSDNPMIRTTAEDFYIHPSYSANDGKRQNDLAIIFFRFSVTYRLPIVCISDRRHTASLGRNQMVFNLQDGLPPRQDSGPNLKALKASWDNTCITTSTRSSRRCVDTLQVQQNQFCASHKGASSLMQGSSGGPYLAEVGDDEEVWVLMGVLSSTSKLTDINNNNCFQELSVYSQVADNTRWVKDCVFDRKCRFTG